MPHEKPENYDDLAWIKTDNGRGKKREAKPESGKGCLVLVWIGAILALAACAGWVVKIWQGALG